MKSRKFALSKLTRCLALLGTLCALSLSPLSADKAEKADKKETKTPKPFPLSTCAVSEEKLGDMGDPYVFVHKGQEVKLCCKSCLKDFDKSPAKFMANIEKANKKVKPYPLQTCAVSDEAFGGDMGEPYVFVHEGREVRLCCKSCLKDFNKEPAKYLSKMDDADKKSKKK